jgi:PTH1 family peptidyl-tRNA hydrolase
MKLVVGLGNPGPRYAKNRHNVGYACIDRLVEGFAVASGKVMFKAFVARGQLGAHPVLLARPLTYMNLSGLAVRPLLRWYKLALPDLLVIYDDLDLPLGRIRVRSRGGSGGHKGMRSIIEALGSQEFARLRIGIGRPSHGEPQDYVLGNFGTEQFPVIEAALQHAVETVVLFVTEGIDEAMNVANASA